jgi:hypothetical protein
LYKGIICTRISKKKNQWISDNTLEYEIPRQIKSIKTQPNSSLNAHFGHRQQRAAENAASSEGQGGQGGSSTGGSSAGGEAKKIPDLSHQGWHDQFADYVMWETGVRPLLLKKLFDAMW